MSDNEFHPKMELSHSTVQGKDPIGWSYHVSFDVMIRTTGSDKIIYKGVLNAPIVENGPRSGEYCAVKALKHKPAMSESELQSYILCSRKCVELLDMYNEMLGDQGQTITCEIPWVTLMDTVSDFQKWYRTFNRCFSPGKRARLLDPNEYVLVEPFIGGNFDRLKSGSSDWRTGSQGRELSAFCHFTWCATSGDMVISSFNGVKNEHGYKITDPVVHSRSESYGPLDQSNDGIADFFRTHVCNDLCENWTKPDSFSLMNASIYSLTFSKPYQETPRQTYDLRQRDTL